MIKSFQTTPGVRARLSVTKLIVAAVLFGISVPGAGVAQTLTAKLGRPIINIPALNDVLKARQKVDPWGCEGLFCTCKGGSNSPSCKIVAPFCADDLVCLGKECTCVWGGGP